MLEVGIIRRDIEAVRAGLRKRNWSDEDLKAVDRVLEVDDKRKEVQTSLDEQNNKVNVLSKQIGGLYAQGKAEEANALKSEVASHKDEVRRLEDEQREIKAELEDLLLNIPNVPHDSVPAGSTEEDNEVYKAWEGDLPDLGQDALAHWDLADKYNLFDLQLGAKITGSGFPVFRGKGSRLQRALVNFFLDNATAAGYEEIVAPLLVNAATAKATGQLPDKEGQMYHVTKDELYLIPTAEVPVTNIYRDVRVKAEDLPIKLTGYTPCFRREAGSYGADVKGLNRVHQFDKVEIVQIQHPDKSYESLMQMLDHVEGLLKKLELPYRILRLCGGDLGYTSALTFDFEVYSAGQKRWLEVSSVSNFETYQSHRLNVKFKDENGKNRLAHTLNGSALAFARIIAGLLENNQTPEGIKIPAALQPYTGFDLIN